MSTVKRAIAVLGTVALAATLLTGCGDKEVTKDSFVQSKDNVTISTPSQANSISWMVHSGMKEEDGASLWIEEFERKTGIDLKLDMIPNNEYDTILELAFISDTLPDVIDLDGEQQLGIYAKRGAVADLTEFVMASDLYSKVDKSLWDSVRINGKIYGVPYETASGVVTYIRKDWLDELGLEVPKNYDEFIEVLRSFRDNIKECKVPLTAAGLRNYQNLPEFYQGASTDFIKVDGKWIDGFAQDNIVEALKRMQDAYTEGLLDVGIVTNTTSNCRDQWYSGSVGAFTYWAGNWGQTLKERLQLNIPGAEVVAIDPIEHALYLYSVPDVFSISNKLSKDKTKFVFEHFIEYMHDGAEGQVLFQSGVEGVHWKQDGQYMKQLPTLSNPEVMFRKAWITPWMAISLLDVTDKILELDEAVTDSLRILDQHGVPTYAYPVSETLNKITDDLDQLKETILAKVVMGDMTVEEGITKYKKDALELGVDQVLEEMNRN